MKFSEIEKEFKSEWKRYSLAIVGYACIFFGWIACLGGNTSADMRLYCWLLLAGSLVYEIVLIRKHRVVISHWIQRQFNPLLDFIILMIFLGVTVLWIHFKWTEPIHNHSVYQLIILFGLYGHFHTTGN